MCLAGVVVGRIFTVPTALQGRPWMWANGHSAATVKRASHGYEPTREAAMAAKAMMSSSSLLGSVMTEYSVSTPTRRAVRISSTFRRSE